MMEQRFGFFQAKSEGKDNVTKINPIRIIPAKPNSAETFIFLASPSPRSYNRGYMARSTRPNGLSPTSYIPGTLGKIGSDAPEKVSTKYELW
ncbi:MAG: hypothetical protein V2G33_07305 [bacterium JZ-2024 1]